MDRLPGTRILTWVVALANRVPCASLRDPRSSRSSRLQKGAASRATPIQPASIIRVRSVASRRDRLAQPGGQLIHLAFANREWSAAFKNDGSYAVQNGTPFFFRAWQQTGAVAPNTSVELISGTDAPYAAGAAEVVVVVADATFVDEQGQTHAAKITTDGLTITLR